VERILNEENKYKFKLAFNEKGLDQVDQSSFYGKGNYQLLFLFYGST